MAQAPSREPTSSGATTRPEQPARRRRAAASAETPLPVRPEQRPDTPAVKPAKSAAPAAAPVATPTPASAEGQRQRTPRSSRWEVVRVKKASSSTAPTKSAKTPADAAAKATRLPPQQIGLEDLLSDVLMEEAERYTLQDAMEEFVGYDVEEAKKLVSKEQRRQALYDRALAALRSRETVEQRAARERWERRKALRAELYRDDRSTMRKGIDLIRAIRINNLQRFLRERFQVELATWQVAVPMVLMVAMVITNVFVFPPEHADAAPTRYEARCSTCGKMHEVDRAAFEKVSFYTMHPDNYAEQYGEAKPVQPECPHCHAQHSELTLITCAKCGQRYLLALTPQFTWPQNIDELTQFCTHCEGQDPQ